MPGTVEPVKPLQVSVKGNELIIVIPFDKVGRKSSTGKSMVHATTNGNKETTLDINGKNLIIGINAYTKVD